VVESGLRLAGGGRCVLLWSKKVQVLGSGIGG